MINNIKKSKIIFLGYILFFNINFVYARDAFGFGKASQQIKETTQIVANSVAPILGGSTINSVSSNPMPISTVITKSPG